MTRPKKFPVILLCFTLVLAVIVTGITKPGFLLPLFRPQTAEPVGSDEDVAAPDPAFGNSRAFSISADTGFSLSAGENALDKDRNFTVSRVADDVLQSWTEIAYGSDDIDFIPMFGWKIDAGMSPEELLPGVFHMDFDLSALGIPEEMFPYITAYHIDDNGVWNEYVSEVDGGTLSVDANHNAFLTLGVLASYITVRTVVWTAVAVGGSVFINNNINNPEQTRLNNIDSFAVYEHDKLVSVEHTEYGDIPIYENYGKKIFTIKFSLSPDIRNAQTKIAKIEKKTYAECEAEAIESMKRDFGENYMNDPRLVYPYGLMTSRKIALATERLNENAAYKKLVRGILVSQRGDEYSWNNAHKMAELVRTSYFYLKDKVKIKTPTYCPNIFMNPGVGSAFTNTYVPSGRAFSVIDTKGLSYDKSMESGILLTVTHEMVHMCQREYKIKSLANPKFDEATAQLIEEQAYDFYKKHNIRISADENEKVTAVFTESAEENSLAPSKPAMENGTILKYMACEMNGTSYKTWLNSGSSEFSSGTGGDDADTGYVYARFIDYLWKDYEKLEKGKMTWNKMFGSYYWYNTMPKMSTMLKQAFDLYESDLTRKFKAYADESKADYYAYGTKSKGQYYNPTVGSTTKNGGKAKLVNQDYTIKTRYFDIYAPEDYSKPAALLVAQDPGFRNTFTDLSLIPVGNTDCENCKHGLFYPAQSLANLRKGAIIEVDGGTQGIGTSISNWFSFSAPAEGYSLWTLLAPDEITPVVENGQIRFTMPALSDAAKAGFIDGYRVTITSSASSERPYTEYFTTGIAGSERSINLERIVDQSLIRRAEAENSRDEITFTVSVCEYIKDQDGKMHFGPESNAGGMNALLAEMGAHDGKITITLHWFGRDDLDLHCITPQGGHISYNNKEADGGYLDVDMNISGDRMESVEHIYFDKPDAGEYSVYIDNYSDRTEGEHSAEIYITVEGHQIIADNAVMGGKSKTWKFNIISAVHGETGEEYLVAQPGTDTAQ